MYGERFQEGIDDSVRGELPCRSRPHRLAIHRLGLSEGVKVGGEGLLVVVAGRALPAGRQAVDNAAGEAVLDERGAGADADGGAAGQQDLLERQRAVVVVGQIGAGAAKTQGGISPSQAPTPSTPATSRG